MKNGWTGGQYSVLRAVGGFTLCALSLVRLATASSAVACVVWSVLALVTFAFGAGVFDVAAAGVLAAVFLVFGVLLGAESSGIAVLVAWVFAAHGCLPACPYGAWSARGRADPGGHWSFTPWIRLVSWIVFTLALFAQALLAAHGYDAEHTPGFAAVRAWGDSAASGIRLEPALLGLAWAWIVLVWFARARPWLVLAAAVLFVSAYVLLPRDVYALAWLFALGYLVDPAWIRAKDPAARERIFYDGACGLCQLGVRFVLAEDASGTRFRFAPLDSETFARNVPPERRAQLPDSSVVQREDGTLLVRSDAALHVLERLGGLWRVIGTSLRIVPRPVRDFAYDRVARVRKRLFTAPKSACPLGPPEITARFDP